jgi:hypothetical protein
MDRPIAIRGFVVRTIQAEADGGRGRCVPVVKTSRANTRGVAKPQGGESVLLLRGVTARRIGAQPGGWEKQTRGYLYLISQAIYPSSGGKMRKWCRDLIGIRGVRYR